VKTLNRTIDKRLIEKQTAIWTDALVKDDLADWRDLEYLRSRGERDTTHRSEIRCNRVGCD